MSDTNTTEAKQGTAVAVAGAATAAGNVPAVYDYAKYAGAGFEGTTAADFKPSFLRVLSGSSPELETVNGAKPGLIIDSVTNDLYSEILFVPAVRERVFVAWKPRTSDGGSSGADSFGGVFQPNSAEVLEALKGFVKFQRGADGKVLVPKLAGGEFDLIETVYFHGVQVLADGSLVPASLSFYSTGLSVADDWYTTMRRLVIPGTGNPMPLFAHVTKLGTLKTEKGTFKWYNFAPSWANGSAADSRLSPESEIFKSAASVYDAFKSGKVDVDYAKGGSATASDAKADKEVPF